MFELELLGILELELLEALELEVLGILELELLETLELDISGMFELEISVSLEEFKSAEELTDNELSEVMLAGISLEENELAGVELE